MPVASPDPNTIQLIAKVAVGVFVGILMLYVVLVMLKSRVAGFRGDHMRVVDTIALSKTAQVHMVEVFGGDVYLVAVANDRVTLVDKVTTPAVVERIRYPKGRPERPAGA
jgi:hypothetical protein